MPVTKNAARSLESGTSPPAPSILSSLLSTSPNTKFHPKDLNHVRNGGHSRQSASALSTTTTRNKNSIYNAMEAQLKKQYPDLEENDVVLPAITPKPKKVLSPPRPKSPHSNKPQNFIEKNKKQIKKTVKKTKDDSPPISPTHTIKQQRSSSGTSGQSSSNITSRPHHQQQPSAGILKDTLRKKDFAATRRPPSPQSISNSTSNHSKPTAHERSHVRANTPDGALREENKALKRLLEQYMDLLEEKENDLSELEELVDSLRKYNSKLISENESLRAYHKDHDNDFNNNSNDDNNGSNGSSPALLIMSSIKQNNKRVHGDQVDNKVDDNKTLATPENIVPPSSSSKTTTTVAKSPSASIIAAHTQPQPTLAKITAAKKIAANTAAAASVKSTTTTTKSAIAPKTPVATSNMSPGMSLFNKLNNNIKPSASMATPLQSASSLKPETSHKTLIHGKKTADDSDVVMEDTTDDDDDEYEEFIYRNDHRFNLNNNATSKNVTSTTDISSDDDEHLDDSSDSDSSAVTNSSSDYNYSDSGEDDSEDDDERPIEKFNKNSFKSDFVDEVTDSSNDEFEYEPPSPHQHYQTTNNNLANPTTSHFNKLSNSSTSSSVATTASVVSTSTKSNSLATSSNSSSDNKPKKRIGIRRQNALTSSNPPNKNKLNNNNNNNNNNGQSVKKSSQNFNSTSKNNNNNGKNNNGLNQKQKSDSKSSKMVSKSSTSTSSFSSLAKSSSTDYNQKSNQTHRDSLSNKSESLSDDSSSSTSSSSTQNGSSSVTSPSTAYTTSSCNSIGKSFNYAINDNDDNYCIQPNMANSSNNSLLNSTYDSLTSSNNNGNNNNDSITSGQQFNSTHNSTTTSTAFTPSATSSKLVSSQIDNNSAINSGHFSSQNSSYVSTPTPSHNIINKNYNLVSSSRQNSSYVSTQQIKSDSINRGLSPVSSISTSTNSVSSTTRVQSPISVSSSRVSTPSCESSYNRRNRYNNNNNSNSTASSVIPPPPPPPENKDTIATLQHFLRLISENSESNKDPKDFYDLKKVIDEGSSAQVFTAHALDTNEECAIKVVPLTYSLEFIFNEIFILKNLKHKNIVDFKESFVKWDGKTREVWLAMEKCARGDVTSRAGKVNQREVSRIARDLLEALKHLHHNGIIHRDIKLSNILSCANNDVKLADFGISSLTPTSTTAMVGTIPYMAPDVVLVGPDRPYDTKVDVWSLGVCILELLTGKAAWGRIRDDEIMDKLRRGEMPYGFQRLRKKADIGWEVVDFLEKCFAKNPENRWDAERLLEHPFITNCY